MNTPGIRILKSLPKIPSCLVRFQIFTYTSPRKKYSQFSVVDLIFCKWTNLRNLLATPKLGLVVLSQLFTDMCRVVKHLNRQTHSFPAVGGGQQEDMATSWPTSWTLTIRGSASLPPALRIWASLAFPSSQRLAQGHGICNIAICNSDALLRLKI